MRLTYRNEKGDAYIQLCSASNKAIGKVAERAEKERAVIERLAHYEDLEAQGRLIELPCAVGTMVYFIHQTSTNPIIACTNADEFMLTLCVLEGRFGKTVFLTQEATVTALKEFEGNQ